MTVPMQAVGEPTTATVAAALAAADAMATALPVAADVAAGEPSNVAEAPAGECVAVSARVTGDLSGTLLLVAGAEIVAALQTGPLGALDPAAALQPAIERAAAALSARVDSLEQVDPAGALAQSGPRMVCVPLVAGAVHHATLVADLAATAGSAAPRSRQAGLDLLRDVEMEVTVEIGRTRLTVRELLALTPGTVLELDRAAGSPADLLVNGTLLARGEIVVVDEDFGIRITEVVSSSLEMDGAAR
jgi:flagellar motor switch protein FliN/FliY